MFAIYTPANKLRFSSKQTLQNTTNTSTMVGLLLPKVAKKRKQQLKETPINYLFFFSRE
jgi:hypothetical protein